VLIGDPAAKLAHRLGRPGGCGPHGARRRGRAGHG